MKCPSCGANTPVDAMVCPYCETRIPSPATLSRDALLERVRQSPAFRKREHPARVEALPKIGMVAKIILPVFFGLFVLVAGFMVLMMVGMAGFFGMAGGRGFSLIPLFMAIVPLGFIVVGIAGGIFAWNQMHLAEHGELATRAALVTGKRTQMHGGGKNRSTSTHYFVTFEDDAGQRQEHRVWDGSMYGRLAEGDAGVLFLRGNLAVDFDRVEM